MSCKEGTALRKESSSWYWALGVTIIWGLFVLRRCKNVETSQQSIALIIQIISEKFVQLSNAVLSQWLIAHHPEQWAQSSILSEDKQTTKSHET